MDTFIDSAPASSAMAASAWAPEQKVLPLGWLSVRAFKLAELFGLDADASLSLTSLSVRLSAANRRPMT